MGRKRIPRNRHESPLICPSRLSLPLRVNVSAVAATGAAKAWTMISRQIAPRSRDAASPDDSSTRRRWRVIRAQLTEQTEPCFGTEHRFVCTEMDCPVRNECLGMRARHLR